MTNTSPTDPTAGILDEPHTEAESLLDEARAKRRELESGVWLDFPIPGYDGVLVARFAKISPDDIEEVSAKMQRAQNIDARLDVGTDLLIERCREVCLKNARGKYFQVPNEEKRLLRFESALGVALGLDGASSMTARQTLYALLGADGESGILGMTRSLMDWSAGVSDDTRQTLAGERGAILQ